MQKYTYSSDGMIHLNRSIPNLGQWGLGGPIPPGRGLLPLANARQSAAALSVACQVLQGRWPNLAWDLELDRQGRIARKQEVVAGRRNEYAYEYDAQGRLATVWRNGGKVEEYGYNDQGQRVRDWLGDRGRRSLEYDREGRLKRAGGDVFRYALDGTLGCRERERRGLYLDYGRNLGLKKADAVAFGEVVYATNQAGQPLAKRQDGMDQERFAWLDLLRLGAYENLERGYALRFEYRRGCRLPVSALFDDSDNGRNRVFFGYDQVGTLKVVTSENGEAIKVIDCDSFGRVLEDSWGWFFVPIGFAGGCRDRHTGFVRFGHRDYDPEIGRFVAQDPLGDTGGDHDLYDYCVDDPVNAVDPEGLKEEQAGGQDAQPESEPDDQKQPDETWTNSTGGESRHRVVYTENAGKPVTGEMADIAQCMADSAGQDITISGAWEPGHSKGSAHETGNAIDINKARTPDFSREKAEEAYERCMPKGRSYAEEKWDLFHIQNRAGKGGATGFSPGVKPGK